MAPVIIAPHKLSEDRMGQNMEFEVAHQIIELVRIIPYPPNFRRTPARIIDPATGASTWALGSQRWVKNIGNFTKKAIVMDNHHKWVNGLVQLISKLVSINSELLKLNSISKPLIKGRDAVIV